MNRSTAALCRAKTAGTRQASKQRTIPTAKQQQSRERERRTLGGMQDLIEKKIDNFSGQVHDFEKPIFNFQFGNSRKMIPEENPQLKLETIH